MNILHALGFHPQRREGERNARSTAEMIQFIRADHYRRADDVAGPVRAAAELARRGQHA